MPPDSNKSLWNFIMVETPLDTPRRLSTVSQPHDLRPGAIFMQSLRENLTGIIIWGMGYSALIFAVTVLYPVLAENNMLVNVMSSMGLVDRLAENSPFDMRDVATYPGYVAFQALGWAPLIFSVYLIPQGIRAIMGEESRGTLALVLSTPIPRWQFFIERALAVIASQMLILLIMWAVFFCGALLVDGAEINFWQTVRGILHVLPISLVIFTTTLLFSVTLRNPRNAAGAVALLVLVSYFVRSLADLTDVGMLELLHYFSIFSYYSSIGSMMVGMNIATNLGLLSISTMMFVAALFAFQRRDLYI